jgi:hypothetical protein
MLLDPTKPVSFKPREDGPTYLLRVPTVADRPAFRERVAERGARYWYNAALVKLAREGFVELLPGEEGDGARALADAYQARVTAAFEARKESPGQEADAELLAALVIPDDLVSLMNELLPLYAPLRRAQAQNMSFHEKQGQAAAEMFLVGWEGLGEFKRTLSGLTEATRAQIGTFDFEQIGMKVVEMMEPTEARLGNSGSPSSPPSAEADSSASSATPPTSRSKAAVETATS